MSRFQEMWKSRARVEKPGAATHSAKWDSCVAHVKSNNPGADAYAVCTAMLGDDTFKAMDETKFNAVLDKALEGIEKDSFGVGSFGIAAAGPIPHSKLSRQDLEGSSTSKSFSGFTRQADLVARMRANQKVAVAKGSSFKDIWSRVKAR